MTSKLVVNTIEADTGISSVSFASSISLSSSSVFHLGDAGINIGADTNISRAGNGILGFNINSSEKVRIDSSGRMIIGTVKNVNSGVWYDDITINNSNGSGQSGGTGIDLVSSDDSYGGIIFSDNSAYEQGYIKYVHYNNDDEMKFGSNSVDRWILSKDGHWHPATNGVFDIGTSSKKVRNGYFTGTGTFGGGVTVGYDTTYSPIQQAANTYFYTRADLATSVSGSNIQNLATGSIKISDTIPIDNMTRQSDAGAYSFYNSSSTSQSVSRNMTDANPFAPKSYGLTMGTLFYPHTSGNNGSGVIHYGGNATGQHFYIRYKYQGDSILIGEDTGSSDVWTVAYQNNLMSDSNWYFLVVAIERNGTLLVSLNGAPLTPIRLSGTAPAPTDAVFGLAGDPYADNASNHRYATAFWHRGVMSNELIAQEYAWLKTIWTGASLP